MSASTVSKPATRKSPARQRQSAPSTRPRHSLGILGSREATMPNSPCVSRPRRGIGKIPGHIQAREDPSARSGPSGSTTGALGNLTGVPAALHPLQETGYSGQCSGSGTSTTCHMFEPLKCPSRNFNETNKFASKLPSSMSAKLVYLASPRASKQLAMSSVTVSVPAPPSELRRQKVNGVLHLYPPPSASSSRFHEDRPFVHQVSHVTKSPTLWDRNGAFRWVFRGVMR
jgi:hypothetical protein